MPLTSGHRVGSYVIEALLGAGGMGEVYLAEDTRLHRRVALKVLPQSLTVDDAAGKRLIREARAVAALDHPNICSIYEVGEADGHSFIAMQYIQGETLKDRFGRGPMDLHLAVLIGKQVADALVESHHHGIIHRDVKPQNIVITRADQAKVLDFGIAKAAADDRGNTMSALTATGVIAGTIAYMSPEQLRGEAVDERSDVFSLGIVLYEAVAHIHPFIGPSVAETTSSILTRDPPVSDIAAPPELRRILRKALERDRTRRYQTMRDLAIDLENLASDLRAAPAVRSAGPAFGWIWWGAATAALAVAAGLAWWPGGRTPGDPVSAFEQITDFSDSATAPSLSADGSAVAFIRGGAPFLTRTGQIYVKRLPNGDAIRLTNDSRPKLAPVFTPDATRVAFTLRDTGPSEDWNTWTVPVSGGPMARLLPNATGLSWIDERHILFSQILPGSTLHMALVTSTQDRSNARTVYAPAHERGMAHYSHLSPDGTSVLVVEMSGTGAWGRCRVVPFDGSSPGRQVGPTGECQSAAWSPDGRWMYFSAVVAGVSHLWRERYPNGKPEPLTSGSTTDEEGVAVSPDGKSLITSIGRRQSSVWLRDAGGERMLSSEGFAFDPHLSLDATRVYYLRRRSDKGGTSELIQHDLASGRTDRILPDFSILDYDIAGDERQVAFTTKAEDGEHQVGVAWLDRRAAPRIVARAADTAQFLDSQHLVFRALEGHENFLERSDADGSNRQRLFSTPIINLINVSPDGKWVVAGVSRSNSAPSPATIAAPTSGGAPRVICDVACRVRWSLDGRQVYIWLGTRGGQRTVLVLPVSAGQAFPEFPADGSPGSASWAKLPGAQALEREDFIPGADLSTYVFEKVDELRNLFRVPLTDR